MLARAVQEVAHPRLPSSLSRLPGWLQIACPPAMAEVFNPMAHLLGGLALLVASVAGVAIPSLLRLNPRRSGSLEMGVRLGTCFGFGTILSTAVVHMLPSAVHSLLAAGPDAYGDAYPQLAYYIILASLLGMHFLDWAVAAAAPALLPSGMAHPHAHACADPECEPDEQGPNGTALGAPSQSDLLVALASGELDAQRDPEQAAAPQRHVSWVDGDVSAGAGPVHRPPPRATHGDTLGLILLELGVSVHSVFIGIGLGVARGAVFRTLLAALCLHQFFEGLALGGAAADVAATANLNAALTAVFALSTPTGVLVGVTLRETAGKRSATATTLEGSLEACATGVLLYVSLVQLLAPHMSRAAWLRRCGPALRAAAFLALWLGAAAMACLGHWV